MGGALASDKYGRSPRVQSFPPLPASLRLKATKGHFHTLLEETVEIQQENKTIKATKIYKQKIQMTASALEYWESSHKCIYFQLLERNASCGTTPSHRHHATSMWTNIKTTSYFQFDAIFNKSLIDNSSFHVAGLEGMPFNCRTPYIAVTTDLYYII